MFLFLPQIISDQEWYPGCPSLPYKPSSSPHPSQLVSGENLISFLSSIFSCLPSYHPHQLISHYLVCFLYLLLLMFFTISLALLLLSPTCYLHLHLKFHHLPLLHIDILRWQTCCMVWTSCCTVQLCHRLRGATSPFVLSSPSSPPSPSCSGIKETTNTKPSSSSAFTQCLSPDTSHPC